MKALAIIILCAAVVSPSPSRPNIVFILTDDQDLVLGGLTPLKKTKKLLADEGITFTNAFATTPICCPSRSSILTGLYLHSHNTVNNSLSGGCSSLDWQAQHESNTFGAILNRAGYQTFYAGKYLNKYGSEESGGVEHVPEGWDWWVGLSGNSVYYNYTLSINGSGVFRGDKEADYLTDVLRGYSLEFLKRPREPFLMVVSPPAPHEPFTPAERHRGKFAGLKAPRTPSFNLPVNQTKHWLLRLPPKVLPPETVNRIDEVFRNRWETLLSVDELVEDIIVRLKEAEVLDNTYVIFTSDHGFHLGQFGLPWDKRQPYDTDIRVPLLVRGPGIQKRSIHDPVLNIDLAPSILNMAGIFSKADGRSFLPLVNSVPGGEPSRSFLVEYRGESQKEKRRDDCNQDPNVKLCRWETSCKCFDAKNNTFDCIRRVSKTFDDIYCKFQDEESFVEFYDVRKDPWEILNIGGGEEVKEQERRLECCRKMIRRKKAVDVCFGEI